MLQRNFTPFPTLATSRLVLRQLLAKDTAAIFRLRSDERVNQFLDRPPTTSLEEASQFIQKITDGITANQSVYWVICLRENDELIGTICMWNLDEANASAELGYELSPGFQGRGIMQEALEAVINFGWTQLQLKEIQAFTHPQNIGSYRLLEKFNFRRNDLLEKQFAEELDNNFIYSLSKPGEPE